MAVQGRPRRPRPVPGLQGLPQRLPRQRRHGHLQGRVPRPPLPGPDPVNRALHDGLAAAVGAARRVRARRRQHRRAPARPERRRQADRRHRPQRDIPEFAPERFTDWFKRRPVPDERGGKRVVLWPDTFTNNFHPHIGKAAVRVLEASGYRVEVPPVALCCGLTWISTGQLGVAARVLRRTVRALAPRLRDGVPVIGLEPSCTAVFRADAPELMEGDAVEDDVKRLRDQTRTSPNCSTSAARRPVAHRPRGPRHRRRARHPEGPRHRAAALPPARHHGLRRRPARPVPP